MKTILDRSVRNARTRSAAFTIVELLVVIAIIGILAALLLPVAASIREKAKRVQARKDISDIAGAIEQYDSIYGRFPVSQGAQQGSGGTKDVTCGGTYTNFAGDVWPGAVPAWSYYEPGNSNVIAILMDVTNFPAGGPTENMNHVKNPQRHILLSAKMSGYDPASGDPDIPGGVDKQFNYRDPWGNPYIITMDLNYDEQCRDPFYALKAVSQENGQAGYNGLNNPDSGGGTENFEYHGKVMVWSMGSRVQGKPGFDTTKPAIDRANRNHILSWQ
jgi:prepilin-type N-terminal cleavage/methylation domain-containing protein